MLDRGAAGRLRTMRLRQKGDVHGLPKPIHAAATSLESLRGGHEGH
jgi:hypothetical protein